MIVTITTKIRIKKNRCGGGREGETNRRKREAEVEKKRPETDLNEEDERFVQKESEEDHRECEEG
jgi:hypothetical protein